MLSSNEATIGIIVDFFFLIKQKIQNYVNGLESDFVCVCVFN
jgi:hypothetical protein